MWNAGRFETNSVFTDLQGNPIEADQDIEVWGTNLTLGMDFDAVSVKSITSYREFDIFLFNDLDFSPHIVFGNTHPEYSQEQFSQELQLTGTGLDSRLNYVVGAYYFKEDGVEDIFNQIAHVPAISAGPPTNFFQNLARNIDNESWALYGQVTFEVTETLHLTVGTRYTESEKDFEMITERVTATTVQPGLLKTKEHTPMASLSYDLNEQSMVYFTYSEGYRDGGFPARFTGVVPIPLPNYEPEFVENYEIGYKTTLFDGRLRANVAAFLMEYSDMQISATSLLPNVGDNTTKFNLGDANYKGFEIELTALITDNFTLADKRRSPGRRDRLPRGRRAHFVRDSDHRGSRTAVCAFVDPGDHRGIRFRVAQRGSAHLAQRLFGQGRLLHAHGEHPGVIHG